jgi:hypothetical protein
MTAGALLIAVAEQTDEKDATVGVLKIVTTPEGCPMNSLKRRGARTTASMAW